MNRDDNPMGLVKFSCGCIGWTPRENHMALLLACCSEDGYRESYYPLVTTWRNMGNKSWNPVEYTESEEIIDYLKRAVFDGNRYRKVCEALAGVRG